MNISIDITNVDVGKLVDGSKFVTEFMPMLEELDAGYDIVYKDKNNGSISMVFSNKPNNIKVFIDILDKLSEYFSNDLLDNANIESLRN